MTPGMHATKVKIDLKKLSLGTATRFVKSCSLVVMQNVKQTKACAWIAYVKIESFYIKGVTINILSLISGTFNLFSVLLILNRFAVIQQKPRDTSSRVNE